MCCAGAVQPPGYGSCWVGRQKGGKLKFFQEIECLICGLCRVPGSNESSSYHPDFRGIPYGFFGLNCYTEPYND
jgi:hypothetical protein